ncbi:MAG: nucleoside-diphosphate-sugar pyrophosphorylase, partial [Bacteroidetes bacterium HGW-Bacteroidetes-22]
SLNMSKMRSFQQFLLDKGNLLLGFDMGKVIDIDHVNDIIAAGEMLKE